MTTLTMPFGVIYACSKTEAASLWTNDPDKRGRIFLEDEVSLILKREVLDKESPSRVAEKAFAVKQKHPRTIFTVENIAKLLKGT